jgi:Putative binding domain, N-terminal/Viral BACON domain
MTNLRVGLFIALLAGVTSTACGTSSTTSTAPSTVPRCGVSLGETELSVPASGGSGTINITTARECAWTANSTASWLTFRGSSSGQGDGKVEYVASANGDPSSRRGVIELNDQRANVTQAAADCVMQLGDSSESFPQSGGSGTIAVQASSSGCAWTAVSDSSWIVIRSGASGTGNGTVTYDVQAGSGPPRVGTVLVAGLRFSITQSENCTYSASPTSYSTGSAGGSTTIAVTTNAGCPWTAVSNVPWVTVAQSSGTGSGSVQIAVEATSGPTRSGTVVVAGQVVTVTQSAGCSFNIDPLSQSFSSQGGTGSASIGAGAGCAWTAASNEPWITLTGPASGSGNGSINYTVAALSGPARTGTISVAGTQITITQGSGCAISIAPTSANVPAAGGTGSVAVTTAAGCPWSAASSASWLTITSGANGSGNGTVQYSAAATGSVARSATITIGGQTFTVNQASGCSISLAPTSASVAAGGAKNTVTVTAGAGCTWTATSGVPWITIASGGSGNGTGTVAYTVDATSGPARSGALTIGGQTFTVNQASGCTYQVNPTSFSVGRLGGTRSSTITAGAECTWTVTSNVSWITVTNGASGKGNGSTELSVMALLMGSRSGTVTVAGQTVTINQNSANSLVPETSEVGIRH